jgi:hypothetical protein
LPSAANCNKAKAAVARKLAVIIHRMWIEGARFKWSAKEAVPQAAKEYRVPAPAANRITSKPFVINGG